MARSACCRRLTKRRAKPAWPSREKQARATTNPRNSGDVPRFLAIGDGLRSIVVVPQRLRKLLYAMALFFALLLIIKLIWFGWMAPAADGQDAVKARADIEMRRAFLVDRVANEKFGVDDMPSIIPSPYRQELAISTLSMTTAALTNLSFRDPGQRNANRDAVRVMIGRALAAEIRRYDVIWWNEDAIDSLD